MLKLILKIKIEKIKLYFYQINIKKLFVLYCGGKAIPQFRKYMFSLRQWFNGKISACQADAPSSILG